MELFLLPGLGAAALVLGALLGLVMGSGMNCLALRLAAGESWSSGRSRCPLCGHELGAGELIPLVSWLVQRGKCRRCGGKISARYPIAEGAMALLYLSVLLRFGFSLATLGALVLVSCLFTLTLVDLDIQEIPDELLAVSAVLRLILLVVAEGVSASLLAHLWPALVLGGGVLALSLFMDKVLGKESMGGGDIKLLFMLGLYFSFGECLLLLVLSCVLGLALAGILGAKKGAAFPFGPAIAGAAWLVLMAGEPVIRWYLGLF